MRHRLPFVAALLIASVTTKAQTKLDLSGLWDNWYVGANTGFNSKLTHNSFMGHLNPHLTLRAGRDIIPLVGVIVEATPFFNDQKFPYARLGYTDLYSKTGVKALNLHVLGNLNLHNLIMDYEGEPRFFEAHFIAGFGLNHVFGTDVGSKNDLVSKIGFDLSLVFGDAKEWEAYLEPALNYNLTRYSDHLAFNPNYAAWQLAVGVNYHLSRAKKARTVSQTYTSVPVDRSLVSSAAPSTPRATQRRQDTDKAITYAKADTQDLPAKQQPAGTKFDRDEPVTPTGVKSVPIVPVVPSHTVPATKVTNQAEQTVPATPVVAKAEPEVPVTVQPVKTAPASTTAVSTAAVSTAASTTTSAPASAPASASATTKRTNTTALGGSAAESPSASKAKATPKASKASASSKGSKASATSASATGLPIIRFKPGENIIADDQYESITTVANYMKSRPRAQLVISGQRARAEAVRNALIRRFGINASRLSTATTTADGVTFSQK